MRQQTTGRNFGLRNSNCGFWTEEKNYEANLDWLRNESETRTPQSQIRNFTMRYALSLRRERCRLSATWITALQLTGMKRSSKRCAISAGSRARILSSSTGGQKGSSTDFPALAKELVGIKVNLIVTRAGNAILAARVRPPRSPSSWRGLRRRWTRVRCQPGASEQNTRMLEDQADLH